MRINYITVLQLKQRRISRPIPDKFIGLDRKICTYSSHSLFIIIVTIIRHSRCLFFGKQGGSFLNLFSVAHYLET